MLKKFWVAFTALALIGGILGVLHVIAWWDESSWWDVALAVVGLIIVTASLIGYLRDAYRLDHSRHDP